MKASSPSKRQRRAEEEDDDVADMDVEVVNEKVTLKAFLETAKQRLHLSAEVSETSKRPEEFAVIFDFLKTSITSWGSEATSLYCCGLPGTGKTMTVTSAVEAAKAWAADEDNREAILGDRSSRFQPTPSFTFCNVSHVKSSPTAIFSQLARSVDSYEEDEEAKKVLEKKLTASGSGNKRLCVLVVDELDLLGQAGTKGADVLDTLYEWAADEGKTFALVCISNSIQDGQDLQRDGKVARVEAFSSYDTEKIQSIIMQRVGEGVFNPTALKLLSKKVQEYSGDCRKALELGLQSIGLCIEGLDAASLSALHGPSDKPPVQIKHIVAGDNLSRNSQSVKTIKELPISQQIVLVVASELSAGFEQRTFTLSRLSSYVKQACRHGLMDKMPQSEFDDLLRALQDVGFLELSDPAGGPGSGGGAPAPLSRQLITLKVVEDDVKRALQGLIDGESKGFFGNIREEARQAAEKDRRENS